MKILPVIGLILVVCSCRSVTIYKYERQVAGYSDDFYILSNKGEFEIYAPPKLNVSYDYHISQGNTEEILKDDGITKIIPAQIENYRVTKIEDGFVYRQLIGDSIIKIDTLRYLTNECQKVSLLLFYSYSGLAHSNGIKKPWNEYFAKCVSDTIIDFNTQNKREAYVFEFAPFYEYNENGSCDYFNPIGLIIDRESGMPISISHQVPRQDIISSIWCVDYKKFYGSKKKIKKYLF